jgi:DNA mismatch repair protein MutH
MENENKHDISAEEIIRIGQSVVGKTFGQLGYKEWLERNGGGKGSFGEFVEEMVYGYKRNNDAEADFAKAGIELKVTGLVYDQKKRHWSAKERLVLSVIDYMSVCDTTFENSSFYAKNKEIFVIYYQYEKGKNPEDFVFVYAGMLQLSDQEMQMIRYDWDTIVEKVKDGYADELTESDTFLLAACPKGENKDSLRPQPYSPRPAMQRAFSYKPKFLTRLVNRTLPRGTTPESIVLQYVEGKDGGLFDYINAKLQPYYGKTKSELERELGLTKGCKNWGSTIIMRLLGLTDDDHDDELSSSEVEIKNVVLEPSGVLKESMSFEALDFRAVAVQPFEESDIYNTFSSHAFFFIVWQKTASGEAVLKRCKYWAMPHSDLYGHVKPVYEETAKLLRTGTALYYGVDGVVHDHFPSMAEDEVCHVRPHARDRSDTAELPVADHETGETCYEKQSFWLGHKYICKIVS